MINDLPPRDALPEGAQDCTRDDLESRVDPTSNSGDSTGRDVPVEGLATSPPPPHPQGYTLMNMRGSETIPLSEGETTAIQAESTVDQRSSSRSTQIINWDPQGFTFHTTPSQPHGQDDVLPYDARGDPTEVPGWGEISHASITQLSGALPLIFPYAALHLRRPNDPVRRASRSPFWTQLTFAGDIRFFGGAVRCSATRPRQPNPSSTTPE